jgi:hypothetical protein
MNTARAGGFGLAASVCLAAALVAAQAAPAADPWRGWADVEPLELASVVDRIGDDAVLAQLQAGASLHAQIAAVRASAFLRSPELALPALARIASSRDPELAPLAARRCLTIAQRLVTEGLAPRELLAGELAPVRAALAAAARAPRLRADLRLALEQAAQLLASLGVP